MHVIGETLGEFAEIGRVSHQPTQVHIVAVRITDPEAVFLGQFNDQYSLRQKSASFVNDDSLELFLSHRIEGTADLCLVELGRIYPAHSHAQAASSLASR